MSYEIAILKNPGASRVTMSVRLCKRTVAQTASSYGAEDFIVLEVVWH